MIPHTNHIKLYEIAENQKIVVAEEDIRWNGLPFLSGYVNKNRDLILGGFDKKVAKFVKKGKKFLIKETMRLKGTLSKMRRQV